MRRRYGDSHMALSVTPTSAVSKPHEGLCVTCKHHDIAEHPFMSFPEVHGAQFLTCKIRSFRSAVNGETSDWCHDIRRDNAPCGQWENDRACSRCKFRAYRFASAECRHPSFEKKFADGQFKGQSYWPSMRVHSWKDDEMVDEGVACGADSPLWEEG